VPIPADAKPRRKYVTAGLTVADAFRQVAAGWAGEFTSKTIADQAIQRFPEIKNKILNAQAVTLAFLVEKGELLKVGTLGRFGVFKRAPRQPSPAELHKQIRAEIDAQKPVES
jgi:hypothetical protein